MPEIRHYVVVIQASEGYSPAGAPLTTKEETPFPPQLYSAVRDIDIENYLDDEIEKWREERDAGNGIATCYIDAYQSVRSSLLGRTLPTD